MSTPPDQKNKNPGQRDWTFMSNHAHVLICLAQDPHQRLREVAMRVGITERAVQKILFDLEQAGVVTRLRDGRRNHYELHPDQPLRHPVEAHRHIDDLLKAVLAPADYRRMKKPAANLA